MSHRQNPWSWIGLALAFFVLVGSYATWVITASQQDVETSTTYDQRATYFDSIPGLRFVSLELDLALGLPNPQSQQMEILAFPNANGIAGVTYANTFVPIGNLDVLLDMQRVTSADRIVVSPTTGRPEGVVPESSLVEYVDGYGVGPIPGLLPMAYLDGRSLSTYPFDEYESRMVAWANIVQGERGSTIFDRDYQNLPIDLNVEGTNQGTFTTFVDLLSTEDLQAIGGGPRPEGGILSESKPLKLAQSEDAFVEVVQDSNSVQVYFQMQRSAPTKFLAILIYSIMLVTSLSVLGVTLWVAGRRKVIALSAAIWAVAVVFTILEARRILPGSPPIGGYGDLMAFFPALAVAATCAVVLVVIWIRREQYEF